MTLQHLAEGGVGGTGIVEADEIGPPLERIEQKSTAVLRVVPAKAQPGKKQPVVRMLRKIVGEATDSLAVDLIDRIAEHDHLALGSLHARQEQSRGAPGGVVVDAHQLADALCRYPGTVIFTSHDRHFMQRVANTVIEVGGGKVASYPGSFEDYVYRVHKELEAGLRAEHATYNAGASAKHDAEVGSTAAGATASRKQLSGKEERELEKRLKSVERKIAKLDDEKKQLSASLMTITDGKESKRVQDQLAAMAAEIAELEHEWLQISGDLG